MAYLAPDAPGFAEDIARRREYVSLHLSRAVLDRPALAWEGMMVKTSNQLFVSSFMSPASPIDRLLLEWGTGIGKTVGALHVAHMMSEAYERIAAATGLEATQSIFVVGFTRDRVIDDLLKFPEMGFVTAAEIARQRELNRAAASGNPIELNLARDHYVMLKRRVTNRARGGYFRFYGYQELVNRVFGVSSEAASEVVADAYDPDPAQFRANVAAAGAAGRLRLNTRLLADAAGSLFIVDECHNLYNTKRMNSWGATLAYVLDGVADARAIFMSATPATNAASEYIDMVNLLTSEARAAALGGRLRHAEWDARFMRAEPAALAELRRRTVGRISFMQDSDLRSYPRREFVGEPMALGVGTPAGGSVLTPLPYLVFVRCDMSPLQLEAYADFEAGHARPSASAAAPAPADPAEPAPLVESASAEEDAKKARDDYYVRDVAFPRPPNMPAGPPLYRARETRAAVAHAPDAWRRELGLEVAEGFTGEYAAAKNIGRYSGKYARMAAIVDGLPPGQKVMIYHNLVKMSGVLMAAEVLRRMGFIDLDGAPHNATRCAVCGRPRSAHGARGAVETPADDNTATLFGVEETPEYAEFGAAGIDGKTTPKCADFGAADIDGQTAPKTTENAGTGAAGGAGCPGFVAARFGVVHGEQAGHVNLRVFRVFNDAANLRGELMTVLVGAQKIRESADLKAVRHMLILSLPVNIKMLMQVIGRGVRRGSHDGLPADERTCTVRLLVSSFPAGHPRRDAGTVEELAYQQKLQEYIVLQKMEQPLHAGAVDARIHREIIMSPEILRGYGLASDADDRAPTAHLGALYFRPEGPPLELDPAAQDSTTFYAYRLYAEEVRVLEVLLRRLFADRPVWTMAELRAAARAPPYRTEVDPATFTDDNIATALSQIMRHPMGGWGVVAVRGGVPPPPPAASGSAARPDKPPGSPHAPSEGGGAGGRKSGDARLSGPLCIGASGARSAPDATVLFVRTPLDAAGRVVHAPGAFLVGPPLPSMVTVPLPVHDDTAERTQGQAAEFARAMRAARTMVERADAIAAAPAEAIEAALRAAVLARATEPYEHLGRMLAGPTGLKTARGVLALEKRQFVLTKAVPERRDEAGPAVGYVERQADGRLVFKLRRPIHEINADIRRGRVTDARLIERGAACATRPREELVRIARALARRAGLAAPADDAIVADLCQFIRRRLMLDDRAAARTFYWHYEEPPTPALPNN